MITQGQLNSEIDLAKRIYIYYWEKMADCISVGSDVYLQWYKDLCVLYFLTKTMLSLRLESDLLYIGDTQVDMEYFQMASLGIREFVTYDVREIVYTELDELGNVKDYVIPAIPPTIVSYQGFNQDYRSTIITIDIDDVNSIGLPFSLSEVDPDSISVTVNDNDPVPLVAPEEEGISIVGSTLSWHTYYNLKAGDRVFIQYVLNVV